MHEFWRAFALLSLKQKRWFVLLVGMGLVASVLESVGAVLVFFLISAISSPDSVARLPVVGPIYQRLGIDISLFYVHISLAIAFFYILKNAFLVFSTFAQQYVNHSIAADFQSRLLRYYLQAPYTLHFERSSAELFRNILDHAHAIPDLVLRSVINILTEGAIIFGIFIVMVVAEPFVTLVGLGVLSGATGITYIFLRRRYQSWGIRRASIRAQLMGYIQRSLSAVKEIKVAGCTDFFIDRFDRSRAQQTRIDCITATVGETPRLSMEVLMVSALVLVIVTIILQGRDLHALIPTLGLYAYAGFRLMPPINRIMLYLQNLQFGRASVNIAYDDLMQDTESRQTPSLGASQSLHSFTKELELKNITYSYPSRSVPALKSVNLLIRRGQSLGIVGSSGAGKSTLVDTILGLLQPQSGSLLMDGKDITNDPHVLRSIVGYVPQSVILTADTLKENIAFGIPSSEIDKERVWNAIRMAQLEDFVSELPNGIDSPMGERGILLSGGQRQRVGIARALYRDSRIIIMDEATSSLDVVTEHEIGAAVEHLFGEKTIIIIAHRLSTVKKCDHLIFMRDGQIVSEGSFNYLAANFPEFRNLVNLSGMAVDEDVETLN